MIPKIIHYCWFGGKEKPESVMKYIQNWKEKLPDFEIREWNESNSQFEDYLFAKEAYDNGKYAFVADVIRLKALYEHGGIYFDTDVEVYRNFSDFLNLDAFLSFEDDNRIGTAVIGCEKQNRIIKKCLEYYDGKHYVNVDGSKNETPNTEIFKNILISEGLKDDGTLQNISDVVCVYPWDYFSAKSYVTGKLNITANTYCIHHFSGAWLGKKQKLFLFVARTFSPRIAKFCSRIFHIITNK